MSYILEALKKSQAERQLGELPTIHAPQLQAGASAAAGGALRRPIWLALGATSALALTLALALLAWRQPAPAPAPQAVPAQALAAPAAAAALVAPVVTPVVTPDVAPVAAPAGPAVLAAVVPAGPAAAPARPMPAVPKANTPATPATSPAKAAPAAPAPPAHAAEAAPPAAPSDDSLPGLRDLPEPIQRQVPPLALGGYIYSKNPADRLLLVDKALRHEGEEVAPGLILEKLLPKAAVFSFKGYRYRVAY